MTTRVRSYVSGNCQTNTTSVHGVCLYIYYGFIVHM